MPCAMIGAFGCVARNSFQTKGYFCGNSAFSTTLSGTPNSLNSRPTRAMPQWIAYSRKASFTRSGVAAREVGTKDGALAEAERFDKKGEADRDFFAAGPGGDVRRISLESGDGVDGGLRRGGREKVAGRQDHQCGEAARSFPFHRCLSPCWRRRAIPSPHMNGTH